MGRPGRKRKFGKREPNGRIQRDFRDIEKEKIMAPMIEARARVHGLDVKVARDPKAETAIGRWCLRGEISEQQWQAADQFAKDAREYSMAVQSPLGPRAVDVDAVVGHDGEESQWEANRARRAKQRYSDVLAELVGVEYVHPGTHSALEIVVLQDRDAPNLVGLVRIGLNALARHYRIPVGKSEAA